MPARKRAVSLGFAVSALRAGFRDSASALARTAAAISLGTVGLGTVGLGTVKGIGFHLEGGGGSIGELLRGIVEREAGEHHNNAAQRLDRPVDEQIVHHERRHYE